MLAIYLFQFIIIKHFLVDFPLQPPYMYLNKGNLKHFGGYAHALLHGVVSFYTIMLVFKFNLVLIDYKLLFGVCILESVSHYFIDYVKLNINKYMNWKPNTHEEFWYLLGLDQFLHYQVYIIMILFLVKGHI